MGTIFRRESVEGEKEWKRKKRDKRSRVKIICPKVRCKPQTTRTNFVSLKPVFLIK